MVEHSLVTQPLTQPWPTSELQGEPAARRLAEQLGTSVTLAGYLLRRGFAADDRTQRYLDPKLQHLTQPDGMADREQAARRIAEALRNRERIFVFGDYDCDGITSAAILTEVLRELGGQVECGLASRFDGGYGLSPRATERVIQSGARLLITCDCGSSDHEGLAAIGRAGLDAIVIDHHLVPEAPLPVRAFLNPHRPECEFPYKGLASCGLVLSIAAALRQVTGRSLDLRRWLDLVAIGTIADVAPLDGDNRALVRAGLKRLAEAPRPGLRALMSLAEIDGAYPVVARDVAFRIAPRLNAPGRLGSPELALKLLLATNPDDASQIAAEIEQISEQRKLQQQAIVDEAARDIEENGWADRASLTLGRPGWNHGIVGIVAGRLAEQYQKPVIVVGFDGAVGRGSVRGPAGARLFDALSAVQGSLVRFGGHQAAAGVEVEYSKLDELRQRFEAVCAQGVAAALGPVRGGDLDVLELLPGDDPRQVLKDILRLEPCGEANPRPEFALTARLISARAVKGGHLKLELEAPSGCRVGAFAPNRAELAETLGERVRVIGELRPDRWRGGDAVEVSVRSVEPLHG